MEDCPRGTCYQLLAYQNLDDFGLCPVCGLEEETVIHLFRDCSFMQ